MNDEKDSESQRTERRKKRLTEKEGHGRVKPLFLFNNMNRLEEGRKKEREKKAKQKKSRTGGWGLLGSDNILQHAAVAAPASSSSSFKTVFF